jgi:uncharacterized protein with von Willebrand factor type A (vWA) domain
MSTLGEQVLRFVQRLRAAGVRISVSETLDAMNAVALAGIEMARMREALSATLIKDEADRPLFEELFIAFFRPPGEKREISRKRPGSGTSISPSSARSPGESPQTSRSSETPEPHPSAKPRKLGAERKSGTPAQNPSADFERLDARRGEATGQPKGEPREVGEQASSEIEAGRIARLHAIERTPFAGYSDLEYEQARAALGPLARRYRVRLGRRLRAAKAGRIDFRRTIRASLQRGGAFCDLRFRARRPRRVDLVVLADVSGSVRYSSTLMLEIIAGARAHFRRVRSFVYVDRLAEADFENGHLLMTPVLDLYARSDFGRVLGELWERRGELLNRATVLVIMGDGRNNRRPARADLLRETARLCRAVVWLIPEEPGRWGTGDSAIFQYAREVSAMLRSGNLRELEKALLEVA